MRFRLLVFAALLALLPGAMAGADDDTPGPKLTLEQLFGGRPFTARIPGWSWRPQHSELVRVDTQRGKPPIRRLLARDPETGVERTLLELSELSELVPGQGTRMRGIGRAGAPSFKWAPSGTAVCAVVKGDLVWVDLEKNERRRLTETKAPMADLRIAKDGRHVSFSRDNELWVVSTKGGSPKQLTSGSSETLLNATLDWVYPEELGYDTAAWWAPDGKRIAYLQLDEEDVPTFRLPAMLALRSEGRVMHYPKAGDPNPVARVGVVPIDGKPKTVWMDLGEPRPEYVARVAWTPDSRRVLIVTLDRNQQWLRVHSCDPKTGTSTVLFEERDEAWIDTPPAPEFVDDDRFLWRSHRDGSTRWWLGRTASNHTKLREMHAITPEGYDIGSLIHYDPAKRTACFAGAPHGSIHRRVYVAQAEENGVSSVPAPWAAERDMWVTARTDHAFEYALVTTSSATTPSRVELRRTGSELEVLAVIGDARSDRLDAVELCVPETGTLPAPGGKGVIRWRLWKPPDLDPDHKYAVIVQVYAGPGSNMVRNRWGGGPLFATFLAQRGFLVLQVDGRGSGGQGAAFKRSVYGRLGILELEDQVSGVLALKDRPYVDLDRVGIWGWSYGGTMACNALTMRSDVFKVGVAVASVTDWRLYDTIYTERYMGLPKDNPEGYEETASVNHANTMNGRLLLIHGLGDDNVHAQNTLRLVEALIRAKKADYELMLYPQRAHGIGGATLDVYRRMVRFFEEHL